LEEFSIILHLLNHCIETAAKKEYNRLVEIMLSGNETEPLLSEKIELLRAFLLKYNFQLIRASDDRLSGLTESKVEIFNDKNGDPGFRIYYS
jgi:hypothetical protein